MSCIFDIKTEDRHCEYCPAWCDEKPKEESTSTTNQAELATTDRDMNIEEIKKTFGEIRELRKKAQEKEDSLIEALVSDGQLSAIEAILVKTPGFGGDKMTEAFVMSVLSKKENQ